MIFTYHWSQHDQTFKNLHVFIRSNTWNIMPIINSIYLLVQLNGLHLYKILQNNTVGSSFATVRFTIHFYDPCRVGPSTPNLWCISVATHASFLYLVCFQLFAVCMCFFFFYFSAVLLSWLRFFHPWRPSKRQEGRKKSKFDITFFLDVFSTTAWAFFNKIKSYLIFFFNYLCNFLYT